MIRRNKGSKSSSKSKSVGLLFLLGKRARAGMFSRLLFKKDKRGKLVLASTSNLKCKLYEPGELPTKNLVRKVLLSSEVTKEEIDKVKAFTPVEEWKTVYFTSPEADPPHPEVAAEILPDIGFKVELEDFLADPEGTLDRLFNFLGFKRDRKHQDEVLSSFKHLLNKK